MEKEKMEFDFKKKKKQGGGTVEYLRVHLRWVYCSDIFQLSRAYEIENSRIFFHSNAS